MQVLILLLIPFVTALLLRCSGLQLLRQLRWFLHCLHWVSHSGSGKVSEEVKRPISIMMDRGVGIELQTRLRRYGLAHVILTAVISRSSSPPDTSRTAAACSGECPAAILAKLYAGSIHRQNAFLFYISMNSP